MAGGEEGGTAEAVGAADAGPVLRRAHFSDNPTVGLSEKGARRSTGSGSPGAPGGATPLSALAIYPSDRTWSLTAGTMGGASLKCGMPSCSWATG